MGKVLVDFEEFQVVKDQLLIEFSYLTFDSSHNYTLLQILIVVGMLLAPTNSQFS